MSNNNALSGELVNPGGTGEVKIAVLGGATVVKDHEPGATVADYLAMMGQSVGNGSMVLMDKKPVAMNYTVPSGALLVVTSAVTNG